MTRIFVYEYISADPFCTDDALGAQGRLMRNAMVADLAALDGTQVSYAIGAADDECAGDRSIGPIPAIRPPQRVWRTAGEQPVDFLRRQALIHDLVWVVAPESDGILSKLRAVVADHQWLGCSQQAIDLTSSKCTTARHLGAAGIATTHPIDPATAPDAETILAGATSWVVKPDDGCGASGARKHDDFRQARDDHARRLLRHEDPVLEPWIEGDPLSVTMLCDQNHAEVLSINRQRISVDALGSISFDGVMIGAVVGAPAQATAALARSVCTALPGLSGLVGIDVTWHPERGPVVIEVNPRVTCAYEGLSAMLGSNIAQRAIDLHQRAHGKPQAPAVRGPRDRR